MHAWNQVVWQYPEDGIFGWSSKFEEQYEIQELDPTTAATVRMVSGMTLNRMNLIGTDKKQHG